MDVSRRGFVAGGAASALSIALVGSLDSVFTASASAKTGKALGYGSLIPDPAGVLDLPKGFSYKMISAVGEDIGDGAQVLGAHDGMTTFPGSRPGRTRLVRNAEQDSDGVKPVAADRLVYDPATFGGTMTLELDRDNNLVHQEVSLAGTVRNCSGGRTPWGTWLTCEETSGIESQTKPHGWVFEVDPTGRRTVAEPIEPLGRFEHEAIAVDPHTHVAYLTEDSADPFGLLYRFRPKNRHGGYHSYQAGGALEAMLVPDLPDLSVVQEPGTRFRNVRWVEVPDPSAATDPTRTQFGTITRSEKLEGASWDVRRRSVVIVASFASAENGSPGTHSGQVWRYTPRTNTLELELVFKPGGQFDGPDNITVSPFGGGVIMAEDGTGEQFLVGTTGDFKPFHVARNAFNGSEFAGVTFSPDGRTLFANRQEPGVTFAITGPWQHLKD
ncbi:MAG: alkaline phosphatase PhoX [Actinomadura sp.]